LATQPKTFLSGGSRARTEAQRVARLAETPALSNAQRWFARERGWINEKHLQLCRIPAPTFFERQRAEWFRDQLAELDWNATLDRAGNVLARFGNEPGEASIAVSAHLDTVFSPAHPEDISVTPDGRMTGPGVADNGPGLSALLALARLLSEAGDLRDLAESLLLIANVGEEGEGNLNGMRYFCDQATGKSDASAQLTGSWNIRAFVVLDGPATDHITAQALASRRFDIHFTGPGGHSWNDYGTPNPVHALSQAIFAFLESAEARLAGDLKSRCSYNFGIVEGGTSINSIPASARAKLDVRSSDPAVLEEFAVLVTAAVERGLERENRLSRSGKLAARVKDLGSRPGGKLPSDSPLLRTIQAVDSYLGLRPRLNCASTDANIPLSLGLPAVSIGAGGHGGGAHTAHEWYHPDGRDLGLRRVLLLVAALFEDDQKQETDPPTGA
jgi:acetylornithine deacetylase/succinyl-diaminopimelate desuccinylase-like protein